jgi:hypothetical protein
MPLRLWPASFEGAIRWRATAKRWREVEDGEKWMVEGVSGEPADEGQATGTSDHGVSVAVACGAHGARAM